MIIIGIDTSCDDTSVGVVVNGEIKANLIHTHTEHAAWGGVVPNLAKRAHEENLPLVWASALKTAGIAENEIDLIAVTSEPGLAPALWAGRNFAAQKGQELNVPIKEINHLDGHLAAALYKVDDEVFPACGLIISGGHTELLHMRSLIDRDIIGQTRDDAIGEAYDKVARLLGLGFPGGAALSKLADEGDANRFPLPAAMLQSGDLDVSYSGLKAAAARLVESLGGVEKLSNQDKCDIAASFERAAFKTLLTKIERALQQKSYRSIVVGGGVAANPKLRSQIESLAQSHSIPAHFPPSLDLCSDNGAMVALVAKN